MKIRRKERKSSSLRGLARRKRREAAILGDQRSDQSGSVSASGMVAR